jgi:hypothetical protein
MNKPTRKAIQRYIDKMPPSISGNGGHNALYKVAAVLRNDFGLSLQDALPFIQSFNARCQPPWSEKDLHHKLASAKKDPR